MEVAARGSGFGRKRRREIVLATVASYRNAMRSFAGLGNLDVWYTQTDVDQLRRQYHVRWLFADTRVAGGVAPGLARVARLRYRSGPVSVYQL